MPKTRAVAAAGAAALCIVAIGLASRSALPGDLFYPARQVLQEIGMAEPRMSDVDRLVMQARAEVDTAQTAADTATDRYEALDPAVDAMEILQVARDYLERVLPPDKAIRYARIEGLERKASEVIAQRRDIIRGHTDIN